MMRQTAPTQDHTVRPDKAVFANLNWLRCLPACLEIDAVRDELRSKSGEVGEGADAHTRRAVNQVPAADRGMGLDDKLGTPVGLMGEMPARARGEPGYPIQLPDHSVGPEMQQVDVLANIQVPDAGILFHDQAPWKNPAEADATRGMQRIAELPLEEPAPNAPRQEQTEQHQDLSNHSRMKILWDTSWDGEKVVPVMRGRQVRIPIKGVSARFQPRDSARR